MIWSDPPRPIADSKLKNTEEDGEEARHPNGEAGSSAPAGTRASCRLIGDEDDDAAEDDEEGKSG